MAEDRTPTYIREHGPLAAPVRALQIADEAAVLRREPAWQNGDRIARTLTKEGPLRVVLLLLKAGARLADHHADGPLALHLVEGRARFTAAGATVDLRPGDLVTVDAGVVHAVAAEDESVLLLTLALPAEASGRPTAAER